MGESPPDGVFGWAADFSGCYHYRLKLPFDQLRAAGHNIEIEQRLAGAHKTHRVVVGQRVCKPGPSVNWQHIANRRRNMLVYEVDDDLFNIDPSSERAYYFYTHPETVDCASNNIRIADLVTVSTEPLAEQLRRYNPNIHVLPNYIDEEILTLPTAEVDIRGQDDKPIDRDKHVLVGYTSSPTHAKDFDLVKDQLVLASQRQKGRLVYMFFGEDYHLPVPAINVGWIPDITMYYQHLNFDIGIAPLARTVFNNSKSYIKALEYAARGIPVIASDEPPYRDFVIHGETGYLARQPYQFGKYLRELVNDREARQTMGNNAREHAKRYTIQEHWDLWRQAYGL